MNRSKAWARCALTTAAFIAAFFLSACASWFGKAESPEQEAFRAMGRYVYLATPASNFVALADPEPGTLAVVCTLDASVYDAFQEVSATLQTGGDGLTVALSGAASALASFSLEVIGQAAFPRSTADIVGKSVVWARVGVQSAATMRAWRKGYMKTKLAAMSEAGADPTPPEWAELRKAADKIHGSIQAGC